MSICLLIDIGSTYTKVLAVDIDKETILGRGQAPTTIGTDVTLGLDGALADLAATSGIDVAETKLRYASSSAAGGLRMAAIGLVPQLTLEAARRACLGAGAKVVCSYGFEIDQSVLSEIESADCDIVLLCGGTDGGNRRVISHNARMLAGSDIDCPVLVAGNRVLTKEIVDTIRDRGKTAYGAGNVLPSLESVDIEPVQALIREIFIAHITKAKGLDKAERFTGTPIVPTPRATLQAATLIADGTAGEVGIGSLMVVEVGGATTNIHSVADQSRADPQTVLRGLPEDRIMRTVEGDLGIRYNAPTIYDLVGGDVFSSRMQRLSPQDGRATLDEETYVKRLPDNTGYVPESEIESTVDIVLAELAASIASERHAGTVRQEFSVVGEIMVQHGKNLLGTENLIGTGGIFRYGVRPERVLKSVLFSPDAPWSLRPRSPRVYLDCEYLLYGIGLLAEDYPVQALRLAKKYLRETELVG